MLNLPRKKGGDMVIVKYLIKARVKIYTPIYKIAQKNYISSVDFLPKK